MGFVQNLRMKNYPESFRPKLSFVKSIPGDSRASDSRCGLQTKPGTDVRNFHLKNILIFLNIKVL
jgi:hypothetical protein